jgi:hypothetical protein
MVRPGPEARREAGERLLGEWGVGRDATPQTLGSLLGRSPEADLAIAHRLGDEPSEESARLLRRLEDGAADKLVRKEARRGLYKLGQRGVAIPEIAAEAPIRIEAPPLEGYLCPVDGRGDQLIWLVKPGPGGVLHLFAVINDPEGLREVELSLLTRKALRALRDDLAAKHELRFVAADWRYCDFLIHRALEWARQRGTRISGDYPALRQQLTHEPPATEHRPLVLAHVGETEVAGQPELLANSADLLAEKELRTWFFAPEPLRPYLDELQSIRESPLVLDPVQERERIEAVLERAVEELFGGELRDSWARRLYEMAYFFWASGRAEQARRAVAAAAALARSGRGGRDIPFFEELARTSLAVYFEAAVEAESERTASSLVLTPQQLRAERARRR